MRNEYYSHSKVRTWRRCHKSYDYKYEQGLIRKTAPAPLLRGVVYHEMLDCAVNQTDPLIPLQKYRETYDKLWDEEKDKYPSPEELLSLYSRYQSRYKDDGLDYQGRSEVTVETSYRGLRFKGIIDKLPVDREGRRWVMDHKTHKVLPDENNRFSDLQTVLYFWALRQGGEQIDGVLWDYIRTKPPAVPEVLKSGGLSRRANMDTDYDTYHSAILREGLDPKDYTDMLQKVSGNVFFKRVPLPRPSESLITNIVEEFFDTAREIENSTSKARNMNRDCTSCTYFNLCQAEVRGIDGEFIKKQLFTIRESK